MTEPGDVDWSRLSDEACGILANIAQPLADGVPMCELASRERTSASTLRRKLTTLRQELKQLARESL